MKKKKDERQYKVGDEFIYHNGKDTMSRVSIEEVLPNGYLLSNQVRMNENLRRMDERADRYPHTILPLDEKTLLMYDGHNAFQHLRRLLAEIQQEMMQDNEFNLSPEQCQRYIRILRKLKKAIEK